MCVDRRVVADGSISSGLDTPAAAAAATEELTGLAVMPGQSWPELLQRSARRRFEEYSDMVPSRGGWLSGTICADLTQNPRARDRASPWLPTLARASRMATISSAGAHVFTPRELACAEGWLALGCAGNATHRHLGRRNSLHMHSLAATQRVQGNAMHAHVISSWFAYVLSHCVHRDVLEGFAPAISWRPRPVEEDNETALGPREGHRDVEPARGRPGQQLSRA